MANRNCRTGPAQQNVVNSTFGSDKIVVRNALILEQCAILIVPGESSLGDVTARSIKTQNISVDTIAEFTPEHGVEIDGALIKDNTITVDLVTSEDVCATRKVLTDTICEKTMGSGVDIDGVLIKDGNVTANTVMTDNIIENTLDSGVTIDGTILKDGEVCTNSILVDTIDEKTLDSGVTIEGILLKDGMISVPITGSSMCIQNTIMSTTVCANNDDSITMTMNNNPSFFMQTGNGRIAIGENASSTASRAVALGEGIIANQNDGFFVKHRNAVTPAAAYVGVYDSATNELVGLPDATSTGEVLTSNASGALSWSMPASAGEVNTSSSAGGTASLVQTKAGVNLPFRGLTGGANITVTQNANDVTIAGPAPGEVNTSSSAGGTASLVQTKVGVNLPFRGLTGGANITVTQNANDVTIAAASGSIVVMDNTAMGNAYPEAPQTDGVWYGTGTKALTTSTSVALGNAASANFAGAVAIGQNAKTGSTNQIAIGNNSDAGNQANSMVIGDNAGSSTMTGFDNTGVGYNSLSVCTSGSFNTSLGSRSLQNNLSGLANTAIGTRAMIGKTTASDCVAVGFQALNGSGGRTSGDSNIGIGTSAGGLNTGDNNTYIGNSTGGSTGNNNVAIGWNAFRGPTGDSNIVMGLFAFDNIAPSSGNDNIVLGQSAAGSLLSGSNNILIGRDSDVNSGSRSGSIVLGQGIIATADNGFFVKHRNAVTPTAARVAVYDNVTNEVVGLPFSGGAGQVLTSDASGAVAWAAPAAAGSTVVMDTAPTGIGAGNEQYPTDLSNGVWYGLNTKANAFDSGCITIGENANTTKPDCVAIGKSSYSGSGAPALQGQFSVAVGTSAVASNTETTAIGYSANCSSPSGVAICDSTATGDRCISVGPGCVSGGVRSIAIGSSASGTGTSGIAIGNAALAANGTAVGGSDGVTNTRATGSQSSAFGGSAGATTSRACAFGFRAESNGDQAICIGSYSNCTAAGDKGIAIGTYSGASTTLSTRVSAVGGIAIGTYARTSGVDSIAIGNTTSATTTGSIALGQGITANQTNGFFVKHRNNVTPAAARVAVYDNVTNEVVGLPFSGGAGQVLTSDASGAIAWAAPSGGTPALADGTIFVGNGSNVATSVAMSGDATLSNSGVVSVTNLSGPFTGGTGIQVGSSSGSSTSVYMGYGGSFPTGVQSVGLGYLSLTINTGFENTAVGHNACQQNTSGTANTGIGKNALALNSTSGGNTAVGSNALYLTSSADNTAVGAYTLNVNSTGTRNNSLGRRALTLNTTGSNNCALGFYSQGLLVSGDQNAAFGNNSLRSIIAGTSNNTAHGHNAISGVWFLGSRPTSTSLQVNTMISGTIYVGMSFYSQGGTLISTVTGFGTGTGGTGNYVISATSVQLFQNEYHSENSGNNNTGVGLSALSNITTGTDNVSLGHQAGNSLRTGSNNIIIGSGAAPSSATVSNEVTIGTAGITSYRGGPWVAISDARDKKDVQPIGSRLDFVDKLKPVNFKWNMRDGAKVDTPATGFLAQDLQQVQVDTGISVPGLVSDADPEQLRVGDTMLIPSIVKALQESHQLIKDLQAEVADLKALLNQ